MFNSFVNGFGSSSLFSYSTTLSLTAGNLIEFAVGYGKNGNYFYDSTALSAKLTAIPEPSLTLGILVSGMLGIGAAIKRQF